MSEYLDKTGLTYLWSKLKATFAKKEDVPELSSSTSSTSTTMAATPSAVKAAYDLAEAINAKLPSTIAGVAINTTTGSMELWSQDLNTVTKSGLYNAMTCTNAKYPYSTLIVIGYYLSGYCTQIQTDVTTGIMATRSQVNGTWNAWKEIDTSNFYTKQETADLIATNFATISTSITNGESSSQVTKALIGGEYKTTITPAEGYYISGVTVTMNGEDVTSQVFTGTEV